MTNSLSLDTRVYPLDFSSYAEIFKNNGLQYNSNNSRSIPVIAVGSSQYYELG